MWGLNIKWILLVGGLSKVPLKFLFHTDDEPKKYENR